jgi:hypothetical protein
LPFTDELGANALGTEMIEYSLTRMLIESIALHPSSVFAVTMYLVLTGGLAIGLETDVSDKPTGGAQE